MRLANLMPCGRLDRYVAGLFAMSYATAILLILGLMIVLDVATHLDYFEPWPDGTSASTWMLLEYYVLSMPFLYVQFSPFVTVVAGIFTVTRLAKKNELTAGLSAGVSAQRLLATVFLGGLLAAGATLWIREYASSMIGPRHDELFDKLDEHREEVVLKDFFFRINVAGDVVHIGEYRAGHVQGKAPEAHGIEATLKRGGIGVGISVERMQWVDDGVDVGWRLEGGFRREVGDDNKTEPVQWFRWGPPTPQELATPEGKLRAVREREVQFRPSDVLTAEKARERVLELSFSQVADLSARDPDNTSFQTLMQYLLTFPLANVVLLLCAVPFLVGRERGKGGGAVMGGLLLCVAYFSVDFVCRSLGLSGGLSPLMSAWLPVLFFGALGISLTHFMRT
ncbi:MAG TPA: LptF/LptG family permease [Planctomycetota bacterium]|nr:LptF/LptG family permease [Planctomycetota bacterium]